VSIEKAYSTRSDRILLHLQRHRVISRFVIIVFIVYLPILYQISLNLVAAKVGLYSGRYCFATGGYSLFPIPFDPSWGFFGVIMVITPLSPAELYIYMVFYPSIALRVMWSVMWLTIGITYIIWPLLSSPETKKHTKNIST
jgi:hypothetical protein